MLNFGSIITVELPLYSTYLLVAEITLWNGDMYIPTSPAGPNQNNWDQEPFVAR